MKQGTGSKSYHGKDQFVRQNANIRAVAEMGARGAPPPLPTFKAGRTVEAPKAKTTSYHCGTQGRH